MHALLVATGGTIATVELDGVRTPAAGAARRIGLLLGAAEVVAPIDVLSEHITPADLTTAVAAIRAHAPGADHLYVTTGSDALAYTAPLIAAAIADLSVPVTVIASLAPGGARSERGLRAIRQQAEDHRQAGAAQVALIEASGAVVWAPATGILGIDPFTHALRQAAPRPADPGPRSPAPALPASVRVSPHVIVLHVFPGMPLPSLDPTAPWDAVVVEPYHSGTVPAGLQALIDAADAHAIPVFAAQSDAALPRYAGQPGGLVPVPLPTGAVWARAALGAGLGMHGEPLVRWVTRVQ